MYLYLKYIEKNIDPTRLSLYLIGQGQKQQQIKQPLFAALISCLHKTQQDKIIIYYSSPKWKTWYNYNVK